MSLRWILHSLHGPERSRLGEWHQELLKKESRGDRAQLRRAATLEEAALAPAFYRMLQSLRLPEQDLTPEALKALAALAMIAARVDTNLSSRRLGLSLGTQTGKKDPEVSEARFRRLLESADLEERLAILRRLVALIDKTVDLREIAAVLLDWNADRRRQLAYDYYTGFGPASDSKEEFPS